MKPSDYGSCYWCIKSSESRNTGEIYLMADRMEVAACGALLCWGRKDELLHAFAPGAWTCFYAASCMDGSAVAVEHWDGEVVPRT